VARNASLEEVKSDWVLVLDADEQLDDQARMALPAAIEKEKVDGYIVTIRNYVLSLTERLWDRPAILNDGRLARAAQFPAYLEHENVRLFRRWPEVRFTGRVHETVGTTIEARGGKLKPANFLIHHFGFTASAENKAEKNRTYRELGRHKIAEMPHSAQAHFELGLVEFDNFHNDVEALALFTRACELGPKLAVAWFFRGMALSRLQRHAEALPCFHNALRLDSASAGCLEAQGDAFYHCGQFAEARQSYRHALKFADNRNVLSKLGLTELRLGQQGPGLQKLTRAAIGPDPDVHDRLITGLVYSNQVAEAAAAADNKLRCVGPSIDGYRRAAVLWSHAGRQESALEAVTAGLRLFPESDSLQAIKNELIRNQQVATLKNDSVTTMGKEIVKGAEPVNR
jgi:tetratricopeptide (TPR) repeat protein